MSILKYDGFPPGKIRQVEIPAVFFSEVLPIIDDLAELKVTLFAWRSLYQREGDYRYLRQNDFAGDKPLMRGLAIIEPDALPETLLDTALERAIERGTLVCAEVKLKTGAEKFYFMNTVKGKEAVRQLKAGAWREGSGDQPVEILPERPNAFALYEANIGPLAGHIIEEIKDALADYPPEWIEDAIRAATEQNKRSWSYIRAILKRRQQEGRSGEISGGNHGRRITGEIDDFIER